MIGFILYMMFIQSGKAVNKESGESKPRRELSLNALSKNGGSTSTKNSKKESAISRNKRGESTMETQDTPVIADESESDRSVNIDLQNTRLLEESSETPQNKQLKKGSSASSESDNFSRVDSVEPNVSNKASNQSFNQNNDIARERSEERPTHLINRKGYQDPIVPLKEVVVLSSDNNQESNNRIAPDQFAIPTINNTVFVQEKTPDLSEATMASNNTMNEFGVSADLPDLITPLELAALPKFTIDIIPDSTSLPAVVIPIGKRFRSFYEFGPNLVRFDLVSDSKDSLFTAYGLAGNRPSIDDLGMRIGWGGEYLLSRRIRIRGGLHFQYFSKEIRYRVARRSINSNIIVRDQTLPVYYHTEEQSEQLKYYALGASLGLEFPVNDYHYFGLGMEYSQSIVNNRVGNSIYAVNAHFNLINIRLAGRIIAIEPQFTYGLKSWNNDLLRFGYISYGINFKLLR